MLKKGQRIGSLILVGAGVGEIEGVGPREVYIFTDMEGKESICIGAYDKGRKISEEALIALVNKHYPVQ
ncbi:MAG: hypothetical protein MUP55_02265 [Candidatus Aenigmarchaeota archaeon]|nr:hypothetical protein [Candidatus Aenigmarchaeota archaeon]